MKKLSKQEARPYKAIALLENAIQTLDQVRFVLPDDKYDKYDKTIRAYSDQIIGLKFRLELEHYIDADGPPRTVEKSDD